MSSILWVSIVPAYADQVTDIATAIGVQPEPADYIVVIDTSGSMDDTDAWAQSVAATSGLASAMGPGDRLTVVTFDEVTEEAWQGEYPIDAATLVAALPAVPDGERTDIGLGLETALDVLERPGARALAAVVLMTDGEITTEPDSPYTTMESPGWGSLAARAAALDGDTAAFALGLGKVTDAAAMRVVFPTAELVDEVQLVDYLSGLARELLEHRVAGVLEQDSGAQLGVSFDDDTVTISSSLTHVPVQMAEMSLSDGAGNVTVDAPLSLSPGESVTLPLQLDEGFAGEATLLGTVTSPWQSTLGEIEFAMPTLAGTPLTVAAAPATRQQRSEASPAPKEPAREVAASSEQPVPAVVWIALGGVVVLGGAATLLVAAARPRLRGSLSMVGAEFRHVIALSGRRMRLPENPMGIRGSVAGTRGQAPVRAKAVGPDGRKRAKRLTNGQPASLGGFTLTWQDERSVLEERLGLKSSD